MLDYFIHSESTGDVMNGVEIDAMSDRMKRKLALIKGTDHYYFYENKAQEIINRFKKTGIYRPRHVTFLFKAL